ncbi:MAG: addiction module antidote protein, HigA family [Betaproteobacteria bacterium]|nr:addiction module antidote protein, HigA family [Betaproteobacteria bacterium]
MVELIPVSPGKMLQEEFLKPLSLTAYRLAKDIGVPLTRIYDIVAGKRAITAETDLLLCRYFGLRDGWWLALQSHHDTHVARESLGKRLNEIRRCALLAQITTD